MFKLKTIEKNYRILYLLFVLTLIFLFRGFVSADYERVRFSETRILMGTVVEVTVIYNNERHARKVIGDAFIAMERVDRLMSNFKEDSDISKINRAAGTEEVTVDNDVIEVIKKSLY